MKKDNHYFAWGLTAVCVVCAIMLIYDLIFRDSIVMVYTEKLLARLAPSLYGCVIAYLLAPIVNWFERIIFRRAGKQPVKGIRTISVVLTWVVVFALLYGLMRVLLPELYKSIQQLFANVSTYYITIEGWVLRLLENNPDLARQVEDILNEYYEDIFRNQHYQEALVWVKDNLLPQLQTAVQAVTGGVVGALVFFKNLLMGVMVSMYLLMSKEDFAAASCKLCYTLLPDFPYAPLVSVVVGVTNIIPFFGPFLGAIPSAFLILLASPIKCLYFIIFVLALQQFDGNILGPRILGNSTGISGFWVIVAILVGGGLWGVAGMFLGVPICACIYAGVRAFSGYRLKKKGLPVSASSYATHKPVWTEEETEQPPKKETAGQS